jgi:hypothetical protein
MARRQNPEPKASERRLEYVPMSSLLSAPRNPKRHDGLGIATAIDVHGFIEPVIVDERTGRLVSGHGRLDTLAARRDAGQSPPDGVVERNGDWIVPTILGWSSRDDADAEHVLVGLNRLVEAGGWDRRGLLDMLDDLSTSLPGLAGTGYTPQDLAALQAELRPIEAPGSFPIVDPNTLAIDHRCPRCGYEWSGKETP